MQCRWRGKEIGDDRFACTSPKLYAPRGVRISVECAKCYCRDHEPVAPLPVQEPTTPPSPGLLEKAAAFAKAMAAFVASGCKLVTADQLKARLDVCHGCEFFKDKSCVVCGCNMNHKASMAVMECPKGKWPAL